METPDLWMEYTDRYIAMFEDDKTLQILSHSDPEVVTSMRRNIGYHPDPDSDESFALIFNVVIVVRDNPALHEMARTDEEVELYYKMLYAKADECVRRWYAAGVFIWEGIDYNSIDWDNPRWAELNTKILMPKKTGAPTITVFGEVIDKAGRIHNLTITDQTTLETALARVRHATSLWDNVTMLSGGRDLNANGKMPYKGVSVGGRKRIVKKGKNKKETTPTKTEAPKTMSSRKKPVVKTTYIPEKTGVPLCKKMEQVRDLTRGTFEVLIGKVHHRKDEHGRESLQFHSYYDDEHGDTKVDVSDSIWFQEGSDEYEHLMKELEGRWTDAENSILEAEYGSLILRAKKVVSSTKRVAYYRQASLQTLAK